jgi:hypothetical protein
MIKMEKQLFFPFYSTSVGPINPRQFAEIFEKISNNHEIDLSLEEIANRIDEYEKRGFLMLQEWTVGFNSPERVLCPSKKVYTFSELTSARNNPALDLHAQRELLDAITYWRLADSEQYQDFYRSYPSFLNEEDERTQKQKFLKKYS